jgi:hypothetical protein
VVTPTRPPPTSLLGVGTEPDRGLTAEEERVVARLTVEDLAAVDDALLAPAGPSWRKVALLVAHAYLELASRLPALPDVFYAQRVRWLVDEGVLESQGNLARMRFSEVRLAAGVAADR